MKLPKLNIEIDHVMKGEEEYGVSIEINGKFAGAADIISNKELCEKIEDIVDSWLDGELKPKIMRRRRK